MGIGGKGGGGGSGGAVELNAPLVSVLGTIDVSGGTGGAATIIGQGCPNGGNGGVGYVKIMGGQAFSFLPPAPGNTLEPQALRLTFDHPAGDIEYGPGNVNGIGTRAIALISSTQLSTPINVGGLCLELNPNDPLFTLNSTAFSPIITGNDTAVFGPSHFTMREKLHVDLMPVRQFLNVNGVRVLHFFLQFFQYDAQGNTPVEISEVMQVLYTEC